MLRNEAGEASGPCWHSFMKSAAAGLGVETFGVVLGSLDTTDSLQMGL